MVQVDVEAGFALGWNWWVDVEVALHTRGRAEAAETTANRILNELNRACLRGAAPVASYLRTSIA